MDETLIAELLRYCRTTYGIDLSRSSSARDLLSAEICLLKCLVRLGRAVMQRWCAALGDGYLGARVTANSIRYRYVGNRQKTVHGLFGAITCVRAYYARLGSTGKGWVPLSERLGIAGGYTPGCQYFMARLGAQQSYEESLRRVRCCAV